MPDARSEWERMHPGQSWEAANAADAARGGPAARARSQEQRARSRAGDERRTAAGRGGRGSGGFGGFRTSTPTLGGTSWVNGAIQKHGGAAVPWNSSESGGGGGGGGGGSRGGAPPPGGQSQATVQDNPYLKEVMGYYRDLWGQTQTLSGQALDPTAAIKQYQRDRTQGLADTQAMSGSRGFAPGTGMSIAQMSNYGNKSDQGSQKIAVDVKNQGLNFQKDLLGQMSTGLAGMTGAASANAQNQLGLLNYGNESRRTDVDAWYKENQLANERTQIKTQNQVAQINAMVQLAGLV